MLEVYCVQEAWESSQQSASSQQDLPVPARGKRVPLAFFSSWRCPNQTGSRARVLDVGLGLGFAPPIFPGFWGSAHAAPPRKVTLPAAGLNWKAPRPVCFEQLALAPW